MFGAVIRCLCDDFATIGETRKSSSMIWNILWRNTSNTYSGSHWWWAESCFPLVLRGDMQENNEVILFLREVLSIQRFSRDARLVKAKVVKNLISCRFQGVFQQMQNFYKQTISNVPSFFPQNTEVLTSRFLIVRYIQHHILKVRVLLKQFDSSFKIKTRKIRAQIIGSVL